MTMNEYKKKLEDSIPTPTTVQQSLVAEMVSLINEDLMTKGGVSISAGRGDGNRKALCQAARTVAKLYEDKGYTVCLYEYSENNRNSYFTMGILI